MSAWAKAINPNCDPDALCTNTVGSYYCTCNTGFYGDGHTCTDYNECIGQNGGNNCSNYATCTNTPGSFTCACIVDPPGMATPAPHLPPQLVPPPPPPPPSHPLLSPVPQSMVGLRIRVGPKLPGVSQPTVVCPGPGFTGTAYRVCNANGTWGPIAFDCKGDHLLFFLLLFSLFFRFVFFPFSFPPLTSPRSYF